MIKRLLKISIALLAVLSLAFAALSCGDGGGGTTPDTGNIRDMVQLNGGNPVVLTLADNFYWGEGYQHNFEPQNLFAGRQILEGDEFTLEITFTANRNFEESLTIGLVDRSPAVEHWGPLTWTPSDIAATPDDVIEMAEVTGPEGALIQAGQTITAEIELTALRSSTGILPIMNSLTFQTEGAGTQGTAGSGVEGPVTLTFTQFVLTIHGGGQVIEPDPDADRPVVTVPNTPVTSITINSPYADVVWGTWGRYRAGLHVHTLSSDGSGSITDMVNHYFNQGFDVLAITDHNWMGLPLTTTWRTSQRIHSNFAIERGRPADQNMCHDRIVEIETGVGRDGRGMIEIPYSTEILISPNEINTFWFDREFPNQLNGAAQLRRVLRYVEDTPGAISHLNHPGRATGGSQAGIQGRFQSNNPTHLNFYGSLFREFSSFVGMEIVNRQTDVDSRHDRILWDNLNAEIIPEGERSIWGFSNDDAHSVGAAGHNWNVMLMPENTEENIRTSMIDGTFYAVARMTHLELGGVARTGPVPEIQSIVVGSNDSMDAYITITANNATSITWITSFRRERGADNGRGSIVVREGAFAENNTIRIADYNEEIGSFIRANIIGPGGIAFTQPITIVREHE